MEDILINNLVEKINKGKIVSFPTETVYALSCDVNNIESIEKIYKIKNRERHKLLSIFIDKKLLNNLVIYKNKFKNLIDEELENGTTIIFNKKNKEILKNIKSDDIGIRIPKHNFTRKLLEKLDKPIVSTSVNLSGKLPLCNYNDITENFGKEIDYVVDNRLLKNSFVNGKPSKIISIVDGNLKVLRN